MLNVNTLETDRPALQGHEWPPVAPFSASSAELRSFLDADAGGRQKLLSGLRADVEEHGKFIHDSLGVIYAYVYGYPDSPCYLRTDVALEAALLGAKLVLEEELIERWLPVQPIPHIEKQKDAVEYLREFTTSNAGVYHELFDYLSAEVTRQAMTDFLRLEVCRNEVVDDEVALLICGLQGNMKKVMVSNLWDECGNGGLHRFHTYWLRRLIERLDDWSFLPRYREREKPWFSAITSNTFNALLTRSGYKYRAYGSFMTTEAWVEPHFERILNGLARVGLDHDDLAVYFQSHVKIDPHHTEEILGGMNHQTPELTPPEVAEVLRGAHLAVAAGVSQYDRVLRRLRAIALRPGAHDRVT